MIPKGLITQVGMIVLAVGIFFTYIQPTLDKVKVHQDEIERMRGQRAQVTAVNNKLASLLRTAESIDTVKYRNLVTYLPKTVDPVVVQRDILAIADEAEVVLTELGGGEGGAVESAVTGDEVVVEDFAAELKKFTFTVGFTDSYEKIKSFLALIEQNNYPLHVEKLSLAAAAASDELGVAAGTMLPVSVTLATYSLAISTTTSIGE